MFLHVTEANYVTDHQLSLIFNDGSQGVVDLASAIEGPIFEPLRNVEYFKDFALLGNTVAWKNGADFAPEYLHSLLHSQAVA